MRGRRSGFTLLETIVALTIVGMALVVLTAAYSEGLRGQALAGRHVEAVALAESRMTELTALPIDSLRRAPRAYDGVFSPPYARYRWHARIDRDARDSRLVRVAIVVRWTGGEYALETELFRPELAPTVRGRTVLRP